MVEHTIILKIKEIFILKIPYNLSHKKTLEIWLMALILLVTESERQTSLLKQRIDSSLFSPLFYALFVSLFENSNGNFIYVLIPLSLRTLNKFLLLVVIFIYPSKYETHTFLLTYTYSLHWLKKKKPCLASK